MSTSLPFGTAARPVSLDFDIELTELPPQPILAAPPAQDGRAALTQEDAALNRLFRRGGRTRPAPVAVPATPTVPPVLTPLPAAAPPTLTPLAPPVLSEPCTPSQPPILSAPSAVTSDEAEREQEMLSLELELPDFDFAPSPTPPTLEVLPPAASPELATLLAGVDTLTTHWAAIVAGSANHYGVLRDGLSLLVARVGALPNRTPQDGGLTTLVDALIHCVDQLRVSGPNPREAEAVRTALATLAATLPHAPRWLPADAARWQADTLMLQQAASPVLRTVPMVSEYAPPTAPADATPAMPTLTAAPLLEAAAVAAASVAAAAPLLVAEPVAAQPEAALDFPFDFDGVDALRMEAAPEATPVAVPPVMTVIPTLATEPVSPTLTAAPVAEVAEVTAQTAAAAPIAPLLVAEPVAAQPEATLDFPFDFDGVEAAAEAEPAPPALVAAPPVLVTASAAAPTAQPEPVAPAPAVPTLTAAPLLEAAAVAAASVAAAAPLLVAEPVAAQPEAALDFPFDFDGVDALRMEAAPEATPVAVPPVMTVIPTLATEPVSPTLTAAPVAEVAEVTAQTAAAAPIAPLLVAEPVAAQPEATLDFPFDFDGVEAAAEAEPAPPALVAAPPVLVTASAAAPTAQPEPVAPAPAVPTLTATPLLTAEPKEIEAPAAAVNPFPFAFDEAELPAVPLALDPAEASPEAALPVLATAEPARSTLTAAPIAEIEIPAPVPPVVEAYTAAMASDARLGFDYAAPPRTPWGFASPEATVVTEPVPPVLAVTPAEVVEVPAAAPQPTAPAEDMFAALVHAVAEEAEDAAPVADAVPMVATQETEAAAIPTLSALDRLLSGAMPALEADAEPAPESEPEPAPPVAPLDDWVMPSLDALDTPPDADRDALLVAAQSLPVAKGVAVEAEEAEADALAEREADDVDETDLSLDFAADSPLELFDTPPQWAELPPPFVSPPAASKAVEASAPLAPALGAAAFLVVEPTSAAESMAAEEAIDPATAWRMAQVLAEAEAEAEVQAEAAALPVAPPPAPPAAPFSGSILVDAIPHVREQHSGDPLGHDLMAQAETWGQPDSYTPSAIPGAILVDDIPLLRRPMRLEEMEKAEEIAAAAAAATKTGSSSVPVTLPPTALAALFGLLNAEAPPPEPGIDRAAFLLQGPSLIQRLTTERIAARLHGIAPGFVTAAEELARCAAEAGYPALAELAAAFAKALAHPRQAERAFEMAIDVIAVLSDGIQLVRANQAPEAAPDLVAALRAGM